MLILKVEINFDSTSILLIIFQLIVFENNKIVILVMNITVIIWLIRLLLIITIVNANCLRVKITRH